MTKTDVNLQIQADPEDLQARTQANAEDDEEDGAIKL
jgi:hypothetical protein